MDIERYRIDEVPAALAARWDALLQEPSSFQSPFLSHAFCRAVEKVRGDVHVLHLRNGLGGEGFLPFQYKRGRRSLGHAEKVGGTMSDHFGIVGDVGEIRDMPGLLAKAGISALRFDHAVPSLCRFAYTDREPAFGIRIRTKSLAALTGRLMVENKDFVKGVLRAERRVATDCGPCEFQWHSGTAGEVLEHLINEKRTQYARTGVADGFADVWRQKLLAELLQYTGATCRPVLSTLHAGGKWVASNLGLICGQTFHIWYPAYDQDFRRYGPGHLLFFKIIERACQESVEVFDFGEGVSAYKAEYKGETYELFKGWIGRSTLAARAERLLQSLEWRMQKRAEAGTRSGTPAQGSVQI